MEERIKETVVTQTSNAGNSTVTEEQPDATTSQTTEYLLYFALGALEIALAFRLVLKLMGASSASGFVRFIYGLTSIFIMPFEGIFRRGFTQGIETTSVLEPSTMVAIAVYAVLVWGIVKLIRVLTGKKQEA